MAAEVRLKVLELYLHHDNGVKQAADAALREFQESDLAWTVAQELLADTDANVQFFAAQTLYNKVQQVAKGYQQADGAALRGLVPLLQQRLASAQATQQAKQRLALALGTLAVHLCSSVWPTCVVDILSLAESSPQCGWAALLAVPEQLSSVVHTYLKTDRRTEVLLGGAEALISAAVRLEPAGEDRVTGTISDSPFALAMQCVAQWTKVMGMQPLQHRGFAPRLAELLAGPARSSEAVLELLIEVLQSSTGAFAVYAEKLQGAAPGLEALLASAVGTMESLLPNLRQMADSPATALDADDSARLCRWARVAFTLVEAYTQILWVERRAADVVIAFLGACFVVHPHVAQCVFELWAVLKDANRDGKLPPGVLSGLLQRLSVPCVASLTRFGRHDSPYAEDAATLAQLRDAQQDIVVDMVFIAAGTPEAQSILQLLHDHMARSQSAKDWNGVEVAWLAFSGIAEGLADEPALPDVYGTVVQSVCQSEASTEEQCATAAVLLRTCGPHFGTTLRAHLVPAVQWLVGRVPTIPAVASEAVQEICGYAGQHLVQHVAEFLTVVEGAAPVVAPDVDACLHGALAGIARHLPGDQAAQAFAQILRGTTASLQQGVDPTTEPGRQLLHRCLCRLLRCTLVVEQAGSGPEDAAASQLSGACLMLVLSMTWSSLAPPCQKLLCAAPVPRDAPKGKPIFEYSDAALQVNILALLRYAAKAAGGSAAASAEQLASHLVALAEACSREGQLAALHSLAVLSESAAHARDRVLPALDGICGAALRRIHGGAPAEDIVPFLDLAAGLAASLGDELFQTSQLGMLAQLSAHALRAAEADVLKPAMLFAQKLAMSRLPAVAGPHLEEVMRAVLANFHSWPRMLAAQVLKLFSAMLERHEAAFLQLAATPGAVPAISVLPPPEQALALRALQRLRGPRLKAFLGDLGAVSRQENSLDVLQAYGSDD